MTIQKLRVAQTLKGKESFDSFLSRKHDPKQPEKFDYVSDQFKEEMGGSLGDIGKAMPEARDQYFGKDTEHVSIREVANIDICRGNGSTRKCQKSRLVKFPCYY